MREADLHEIQNLSLLKGMAPDNLDRMMRAAYAQDFPAQLQLFSQGGRADFLHVLIEGAVVLSTEWKGREAVMAIMRPVSSFILAACMLDKPLLMSARTLSPSRIILIPTEDARAAFRQDHGFAEAANQQLAAGFRSMVEHAKDLKLRKSHERLAAYLLEQSLAQDGALRLVIDLEKRLLASYLGMTPESLSRAFRLLEDHGVSTDGPVVSISDPEGLARLAEIDGDFAD